MKTVDQIKSALDNNEFYLEYMPTILLDNGHCVGAEALIRWQHGDERVPPDEFISVIENTPVSGLLTYWIIEEIGRELGDWLKQTDDVHIGINIPPDVIGRGGIEYAASKAGLIEVADKLLIEVTERGFPDEQALAGLSGAKGRTKVAIDDFGTGDANLMQLSQMHADVIKIDKFFVDQITTANKLPRIMKGLVAYGLAMDFEIIAEGVESDEQAESLKSLGVHMAQGWHYSKPLRASDFLSFYQNRNNSH